MRLKAHERWAERSWKQVKVGFTVMVPQSGQRTVTAIEADGARLSDGTLWFCSRLLTTAPAPTK